MSERTKQACLDAIQKLFDQEKLAESTAHAARRYDDERNHQTSAAALNAAFLAVMAVKP